MRTRALAVISLLTLASGLTAQGVRPPRVGRGAPPTAAPLPPEIEPVSRALAYKRSRWSAEGYTLFSSVRVPAASGTANYSTIGAGTHGDYQFNPHFSATVDATASAVNGSMVTESAEVGTRFRPMPFDQQIRPFVDVRATYLHMYDTYTVPGQVVSGANAQYEGIGRYSRGLGSLAGAGLEVSLSPSLALTTEVSGLRNKMTTYRVSTPGTIPTGSTYWMTTYRYTVGLRYNRVMAAQLAQKPR